MQWWQDLVTWLGTDRGQLVLLGGVVPFFAILASGLLAAGIARRSVTRVLARRDREARAATIGLLVDVAHQSSMWSSSSPGERTLIERAVAEADLALRLLPVSGAHTAAEWAAAEIAGLRRASAAFSLEFDIPLAVFRDRLIEWHRYPHRARKGFERDLARWRVEDAAEERRVREQAEEWSDADVDPGATAPAPRVAPSARNFGSSAIHTRTTSVDQLRSFRPVEKPTQPGQVQSPTDGDFARPASASLTGGQALGGVREA